MRDLYPNNGTAVDVISAIVSSYYGGVLLGIILVSWIADHFGRKYTIQIGGGVGLLGAILQVASPKIAMFLVGRVIAGAASGIMLTTVSIYQSESQERVLSTLALDTLLIIVHH